MLHMICDMGAYDMAALISSNALFQGRIFGGTVFGDHIVGNSVEVVIGISKLEKYTKEIDPYTNTKELKIQYLDE